MGAIMTMADVISSLGSFDAEDTIYAALPWSEKSAALVAHELESGGVPSEERAQGLEYFMEVFVARDFLEDWKSSLKMNPSREEICAKLIHYAIHDA